MRFTPFPFEDTTWLVEQAGPELFMFSTDYPHPEGGRRPFEIFGEAMAAVRRRHAERFFWRNGAELLGLGADSSPPPPSASIVTGDSLTVGRGNPKR